jgi:hypothetical protein
VIIPWSDFDAATLPLTGNEIVALAISGVDNVQLSITDFVAQILNFSGVSGSLTLNDGIGNFFGIGQRFPGGWEVIDGNDDGLYIQADGSMSLTSITTNASINLDSDGSFAFYSGNNLSDGFAFRFYNGQAGNFVFGGLDVGDLQMFGSAQNFLDSNGNPIFDQDHTFYDLSGNAGFTGTLAAAIAGGKNVAGGIIIG